MGSIVQSSNGDTGNTNPLAEPFTSNVTVGNTLVCCMTNDSGTAPGASAVSDNLGNTWTRDAVVSTGANASWAIYSAPVTTGGACTVSLADANGHSMCLFELSGAAIPTSVVGPTTANGTAANPSTGNVVLSTGGVLIAHVAIAASDTITGPGGSWTQHGYENESSANMTINAQSQVSASGGTYSCTWTVASHEYVCGIIGYVDDAGPGVPGPALQNLSSPLRW